MPGLNSKFDPTKLRTCDRLLSTNVHVFVLISVATVEVWGVTRFYLLYPHLRYSAECLAIVSFLAFCDYMTFAGMFATKYADPGYLLPSADGESSTGDFLGTSVSQCRKCGQERSHERVSHCSRCDRCVDYMDHHCLFTDNCIGKKNFPFFFQFILWADFALAVGLMLVLANISTRNISLNYGAQGILDIFTNNPQFQVWAFLLSFGSSQASFFDLFDVKFFDAFIIIWLVSLMLMVTVPGLMTFRNIQHSTSEVLKLKTKGKQKEGDFKTT